MMLFRPVFLLAVPCALGTFDWLDAKPKPAGGLLRRPTPFYPPPNIVFAPQYVADPRVPPRTVITGSVQQGGGVQDHNTFQSARGPYPNVNSGGLIDAANGNNVLSPGGRAQGGQHAQSFQAVGNDNVGEKQSTGGGILGADAQEGKVDVLTIAKDLNINKIASEKTKYKVNPSHPYDA